MAPTNAATLRGMKAALTSRINTATRQFDTINAITRPARPTSKALDDLQAALDKVREQQARISSLLLNLIGEEEDEAAAAIWQTELTAADKRADDICDAITTLLAAATVPATAPPGPAAAAALGAMGGGSRRCKPNDALRPDKLTTDYSPADYTIWKESFHDYFTSSNMDVATASEQRSYLFNCISLTLQKRLRGLVQRNTPVYDTVTEKGCMTIIDEEFMEIHPVVARRLAFFKETQGTKEFKEFVASVRSQADEADLASITPETLVVMRIVAGTTDEKLREKFLREDNLTFAVLMRIAKDYERGKTANRAIGEQTGRPVAAAAAVQQAPDGRSTGARQKTNTANFPRDFYKKHADNLRKQGKCPWCGGACKGKFCDKKSADLSCGHCNKKGHVKEVCATLAWEKAGKPEQAKAVKEEEEEEEAAVSVVTLNTVSAFSPTPRINARIEGGGTSFRFRCLPDTGATRTVIASDVAEAYGLRPVRDDSVKIRAANGNNMACEGTVSISIAYKSFTTRTTALVSSCLSNEILIGWQDLVGLAVIHKGFPAQIKVVGATNDRPVNLSDLVELFDDVFQDGEIKPMKGKPMKIHLEGEVKPTRVLTARQIPVHLRESAAEIVKITLDSGVIVPVNEPTEWISPAFFVPKPKGGARLVCDFTGINRFVRRPVHPFPSPQQLLQCVGHKAKVFATFDAVQGYHQIPLDYESSLLTTFILPSGRFRYTRAPMGLNASSDEWCARSDAALEGVEGVQKIVDDILIWAEDGQQLRERVEAVLSRCRQNGITLSRKKARWGSRVNFAGFIVSADGVEPEPEKLKAISDFPRPRDVPSLRSFLGLAVQLGGFVPDLAHMTAALRELLKKGVAYQWLEDHERCFQDVKAALTSPMCVRFFDPDKRTELLTDASRLKGLGFALTQLDGDKRTLIKCGSRSLNGAESRYATLELEALAIKWAIASCKHYLMGGPTFTVVTDHKPLVPMFRKGLGDVENARVLRYREQLTQYSFEVQWVPGKTHEIADALSRAPIFDPPEEADIMGVTVGGREPDDPSLRRLIEAAKKDADYMKLMKAWREDRNPKELGPSHPAKPYASVWSQLSVSPDGCLMVKDGYRIVPPREERAAILSKLHLGHGGILRTRKLAGGLYFWPGMNNDVKTMIDGCEVCQQDRPSQPREEDRMYRRPAYPMHSVAVDPFEYAGVDYLVMADRYSNYCFVARLRNKTANTVIQTLEGWFLDYGYPRYITSDSGRQFLSDYEEWCEQNDIIPVTSSPHNHESNGLAESAVKQMKALLKKTGGEAEFRRALLHQRNTPRSDGAESPAELFFGRSMRRGLPVLEEEEEEDWEVVGRPPLVDGQRVRLQDPLSKRWDALGTVVSARAQGRSYVVQRDGGGRPLVRNRRYLKPIEEPLTPRRSTQEHPTLAPRQTPSPQPPPDPRRSQRLREKQQNGTKEEQAGRPGGGAGE
jgi:transposase InsO family protein